jgi:hypothetical protein
VRFSPTIIPARHGIMKADTRRTRHPGPTRGGPATPNPNGASMQCAASSGTIHSFAANRGSVMRHDTGSPGFLGQPAYLTTLLLRPPICSL